MIKSMTAFAREARTGEWGELVWELRSVNHRYLEVLPRLPEELRALEEKVRERVGRRVRRGKVECTLRHRFIPGVTGALAVNRTLAEKIAHASREVDALLYNPAPVSAMDVLRWPGVLESEELDWEPVFQAALDLLEQALAGLVATREREGTRLDAFLKERLAAMDEVVTRVRARMPEVLAMQRERLRTRMAEVMQELDAERVEQEIVLIAQKLDVDEEMGRLAAHLEEVGAVLGKREPVGRRLDFLMQELNREANTLGSKSGDVETTRAAVDL
jgi:uncharacterized protein (TIGR00255 family)